MCQVTHMGRRSSNFSGDWLPLVFASGLREPAHRSFPKVAEHVGPGSDRRRLRLGGPALSGRRARRHRAPALRTPPGRVRLPDHRPPQRRRERLARAADGVPAQGGQGGASGRRAGPRARHPDVHGRGPARGVGPRRGAGGAPALRRRRGRVRQRHQGHHRERCPPGSGDPVDGHSVGALPRVRRGDPSIPGHPSDARRPDLRRVHRPLRHPRGSAGPGRHDPGTDGRPLPGAEAARRGRGPDPAVRGGQLLPRRDL